MRSMVVVRAPRTLAQISVTHKVGGGWGSEDDRVGVGQCITREWATSLYGTKTNAREEQQTQTETNKRRYTQNTNIAKFIMAITPFVHTPKKECQFDSSSNCVCIFAFGKQM